MLDDKQLDLRVLALEFILQNLLVAMHSNAKDPIASIEMQRAKFRGFFERNGSKFEQDLSDVPSQLLAGAVDQILENAQDGVQHHLSKKDRRS